MEFEEFPENKNRYHENSRGRHYPANKVYVYKSHHSSHEYAENIDWIIILRKIMDNRKLRILVVFAILLILTILIVLIIVLLPLIIKLINFISQTGLQGILNEITGFLDKILKGFAN